MFPAQAPTNQYSTSAGCQAAAAATPVESSLLLRRRRNRREIRSLLVFGAGVAAFFSLLSFTLTPAPVPAATLALNSAPLHLQVARHSDQWLLTWDPSIASVKTASRAVLSITDGARSEDVELYLPQFRTGGVLYAPLSNDVSFRLQVVGSKGSGVLSESIRVLGARHPAS